MIQIKIPGRGDIRLEHLVSDLNGTLAVDGEVSQGAARALAQLKDLLDLHLVTGDIHGNRELIGDQLGVKTYRVPAGRERKAKADYVRELGSENVVAIGQGANDADMLKEAKIGICVLSPEGLSVEAMMSADILVRDLLQGLALLKNTTRLSGTLRR